MSSLLAFESLHSYCTSGNPSSNATVTCVVNVRLQLKKILYITCLSSLINKNLITLLLATNEVA